MVSAADVRSVNILKDIASAVQGIWSGENYFYSHLLNECSAAAMDKLVVHAKTLGATGIVDVRLQTTTTMNRLIVGLHTSVLAYGTAVRVQRRGVERDGSVFKHKNNSSDTTQPLV